MATPAEQREKWQLVDVTPCAGCSAALVIENGPLTINQFSATTLEQLLSS
jgi:hypothetical protein